MIMVLRKDVPFPLKISTNKADGSTNKQAPPRCEEDTLSVNTSLAPLRERGRV